MAYEYTYATFLDDRKSVIEAIAMHKDGSYEAVHIDTNLENEEYLELLEKFSLEEIATMSDQKKKDDWLSFEAVVKDIAEQHGLIYDPNAIQKSNEANIDEIFNPPEGDDGVEFLFNIKLKIFDMPEVIESEDAELKKELREAETPLQALYVAGKFLYK